MDNLDQQFFQFAMTYRDPYKKDALTAFANLLEADSGFPRSHSNYADLADYLELRVNTQNLWIHLMKCTKSISKEKSKPIKQQ